MPVDRSLINGDLRSHIQQLLTNQVRHQEMSKLVPSPFPALFVGGAGCGKTFALRALVERVNDLAGDYLREPGVKASTLVSFTKVVQQYDAATLSIDTIHQGEMREWERSIRDRQLLVIDNLGYTIELKPERELLWRKAKASAEKQFAWVKGLPDTVETAIDLQNTVIKRVTQLREGMPIVWVSSFMPAELIDGGIRRELIEAMGRGTYVACDLLLEWSVWRSRHGEKKGTSS